MEIALPELAAAAPRMANLRTWVTDTSEMSGVSVWVDDLAAPRFYLQWEWSLIAPHVVGMNDPSLIESNIRLVDAFGVPMTSSKRLLAINAAVHALNWHDSALVALQASLDAGKDSPAGTSRPGPR